METNTKRIFIVDDESIIAFEMADTLEDLGFEVVGPSTQLSDALSRAEDEEFDVACLDVNLGNGKTSEPIAKILKDRGIPYVYITAYDANQVSFVDETDRVLKKPVSKVDLRNALLQSTKD